MSPFPRFPLPGAAAAAQGLATLAAVLAAARALATTSGHELVDASRDAFFGALHSGLGAAIVAALTVLALRLLRGPGLNA
jgi:hypothetical protein